MLITSQVAGLVVELRIRVYDVNACIHLPKRTHAMGPIYSGYVPFHSEVVYSAAVFLTQGCLGNPHISDLISSVNCKFI